jgi:hypothetical protein
MSGQENIAGRGCPEKKLIQYIKTGRDLPFAYRANGFYKGKCLAKDIDAFKKYARCVAEVFFAEYLSALADRIFLSYRLSPECLIDVFGDHFLFVCRHT